MALSIPFTHPVERIWYLNNGLDEMTNTTDLFYMVRACAKHFRLNWNQQDITDTTHYLNTKFFQLDE
jgi:hypothetical protein